MLFSKLGTNIPLIHNTLSYILVPQGSVRSISLLVGFLVRVVFIKFRVLQLFLQLFMILDFP
ncbi:uncharacterized protein RHIMIDRAFT_128845 [Rhizopus microsporus ATCC 52813]|uniref:Uncharacterized protein n=1 Tax=Rhizopus microsporus ATCC 52813 TaxID=1340429 RepID=A0A2G4SWJ4_RHIZD|nr:uncharacterized protein RHIMIDRAFT_128845 [Rhizopus microsporus ATCC 52813]PHZ13112.1 hypothetical protein RHIMIDRAFT_128845 [Rhizopus microsporus ATCC 52813]